MKTLFGDLRPYSENKLELNSKKVELEWCKSFFVCICIFLCCTKSRTSGTQV